jgi:hypothetical protein
MNDEAFTNETSGLRAEVVGLISARGDCCTLCGARLPSGVHHEVLAMYAGKELLAVACHKCTARYRAERTVQDD